MVLFIFFFFKSYFHLLYYLLIKFVINNVYCFFFHYSMNLVDKYILRQLFNNSILILILIISLFCLAKSVQLIEFMVGRGLPFYIFSKLIFLSLELSKKILTKAAIYEKEKISKNKPYINEALGKN